MLHGPIWRSRMFEFTWRSRRVLETLPVWDPFNRAQAARYKSEFCPMLPIGNHVLELSTVLSTPSNSEVVDSCKAACNAIQG